MEDTASIIMAAGRGSRMKGYDGNKTLLPLIPGESPLNGERPILVHILENLPKGPKAVIVHHKKEQVMERINAVDVTFCEQSHLNGTGGALLAAQNFIGHTDCDDIVVTMGDVPFIKAATYLELTRCLKDHCMVVLGFVPRDRKQYGTLEISEGKVKRIVEWKYWRDFPADARAELNVCNSGIYAFKKNDLIRYLSVLASRPQRVVKEIDGRPTEIEEFFITDIVEYMVRDGLPVGYILADDESEAMGVDDLEALTRAQHLYAGVPLQP